MDGWNYGWMMCLNVKHPFSDISDIKCGKANWEKLVVEPHEMSMEVDGWILWNWWNCSWKWWGWNWWKNVHANGDGWNVLELLKCLLSINGWMKRCMVGWMD